MCMELLHLRTCLRFSRTITGASLSGCLELREWFLHLCHAIHAIHGLAVELDYVDTTHTIPILQCNIILFYTFTEAYISCNVASWSDHPCLRCYVRQWVQKYMGPDRVVLHGFTTMLMWMKLLCLILLVHSCGPVSVAHLQRFLIIIVDGHHELWPPY